MHRSSPNYSLKPIHAPTKTLALAGVVWWAIVVCVFCLLRATTTPHTSTVPSLGHPAASDHAPEVPQNSNSPPSAIRHNCEGKYVYIHTLPAIFNEELTRDCKELSPWTDMCRALSNGGLGPKIEDEAAEIVTRSGWYATDQFALDVIFHRRMRQYKCLTEDSSRAALIYVPFYAGLDIGRNLWGADVRARDALSLALVEWLGQRPEWARSSGHDHFVVCGRMTWDLRRLTDRESEWGNKLLRLPHLRNMSALLIEKSPWHRNDYAIPYPTYFHPSSSRDVAEWQERLRNHHRPLLFSFAGAPRQEREDSVRAQVLAQCRQSQLCTLLECGRGATNKCHSPLSIMGLFQNSVFCLQPQGDSFTRRSFFDAMVAGCIPVLFNPHSAYTQYTWHLPAQSSDFSVFISDEEVKKKSTLIEDVLGSISAQQIHRLRENVIRLMPTLVYADPSSPSIQFRDAFDVAVEALLGQVRGRATVR